MISPLAALFLLIPWVNKIWNRLKWLSSRTWVSVPTYLCSWQACGALLQPLHRKKKKNQWFHSTVSEIFLLSTDTFLEAAVMGGELRPGSELDPSRPFGTCGWSSWASVFSEPLVHDSRLFATSSGIRPTWPQKETDRKLGGPGRKLEAHLGWLETGKTHHG